jgi:hypothetical protein
MSSTSYVPPSFANLPKLLSLHSERDLLHKSWQYLASPDFGTYAHWEPITASSNELREAGSEPATIIIVGQVFSDKLIVCPLGNFQLQEEKQQRYQDSEPKNCLTSKLVIVLCVPTSSTWKSDYITATKHLEAMQEQIAKGSSPRQHLLDKDHDPFFVQLSFPLWEKKVHSAIMSNNTC